MVGIDDVLEGRYRITKQLAEGDMGFVFLAQLLPEKRKVAIKVLRPELATDANVVERFLNEARLAGQVGHANLVESIDAGHAPLPYVVFEYLKGAQLVNELGRVVSMPVVRATRIAIQIANAMHAAHEAGLVHRHLTADNILVSDDPSPDHVKVTGFGSKFVSTPDAIAPELLKKPNSADRRSDIYALGVLLHEMLTGQRPKKGSTALNRASISSGLAELLADRMLAKDPAARPQTMAEVAVALDGFASRQAGRALLRPRVQRPSESAPFPRGRVSMLDTASHPIMSSGPPVGVYAILGLSVVLVALIIAWTLKSSTRPDEHAPVAEHHAEPAPAAAASPPPPMTVKQEAHVTVSVESDVAGARVTFRRRIAPAPLTTDVLANQIVELVEVAAPGYKTERYWLTLDRPTHLKAHLVKGTGLDEATEEATLYALGEHAAPEVVATVEPKQAVVARPATVAPRRIGRSAEPPPAPVAAVPEPVVEAAPPPPPPAPVPAPTPAPIVEAPKPVALPVAVVAPAAPRNISPAAFKALRTSGDEAIAPPSAVALQMGRDSKPKVSAAIKACVSATGEVSQVSLIKSSGYPDYDKALVDGVRGWRFKSGEAVCSAVAFAYKL